MPSYKLTYFDARGRGELVRLIFAATDNPKVEYEDKRIQFEDWPGLKPTTPFGTLPILQVDDQVIGNSLAVARYVARAVGLAGQTLKEQALADSIVDTVTEVLTAVLTAQFEPVPEDEKAAKIKKIMDTTASTIFTSLEKLLKSNNGGNAFFVGDGLTWADIAVMNAVENVQPLKPDFFENFNLLNAHRERIARLHGIKNWLASRPNSMF